MSHSLWSSLRSLATGNINVVKLSLNGNNRSWVVTCVAFHVSLVSGASGSSISSFLVYLHFSVHISKVLVSSSLFAHGGYRQHVRPSISQTLQEQ